MSNVIHIAGVRHKDTIGVLRYLLARAERGEVGGLNFVIDDLTVGREITGYTGTFRKNPARIGSFLARLAVRLCTLDSPEDEEDAQGTSH
jgi:hypothetical protein